MVEAAASFRLACRAADDELFRLRDCVVSTAVFLGMACQLADELPAGAHVVNLCQDRLHFAVALAAAMLRGQVSLLTSDRSPDRLRMLAERFDGLYSLSDAPEPASPLPHHRFVAQAPRRHVAEQDNPQIAATRLAAVVFTSGSTGEPVPHHKSWGALVERSIDAAACFGMTAAQPASVVGMVPPQHMYGFETTVLLPLHAAASAWCSAAFYPEDVADALRTVPEPRVLVTTPLQIRALLQASIQLPPVAHIISATAPLFPDMAAAAEQRWDTQVFEIFGATEVGSIASRRTVEGDVWTTYPRVRISHDGTGDERSDVAVVSGPFAVPCGLSDVIETLDASHFRLIGRRADMVKLGGRRASLAELNRILIGIEGVLDGQFIAPDDLDRHPTARLLVFVVAPERSADDILAALRSRIDPPFLPRRVIRVDELPRNDVGKLTDQTLGTLRTRLGDV
jgi:acyl-coenzyme A synthetase/AMP-(fatty) acid ligase